MTIRPCLKEDWQTLKEPRLAALLDAPTAFGVSHRSAMWTRPRVRGSGIAAQLVDAVKADAIDRGHGSVFLDLAPDNGRAASFYLRQGFAFIDEWEPLASHPHIQVQTMQWRA